MWSYVAVCILWIFLCDNIVPSSGVWPKPRKTIQKKILYEVRDRNPDIIATGHKCTLLRKVTSRMTQDLSIINDIYIRKSQKTEKYKKIVQLKVNLTEPCEEYPYLGMDENYKLSISTTSKLEANSVWGIIRGLETFVQLFYEHNKNIYIRHETIVDYPNYEHRGLMLDTGQNFVPVYHIAKILDGMAMNKLNVFHWSICGNKICPIKSETVSNISTGLFSSTARNVYTKDDIKMIVKYARERGIRVIPEFNIPGHQAALQKVVPSIFLNCTNNKNFRPVMNPTLQRTYDFLKSLLDEVISWFPDGYIHLGGDETYPECWNYENETLKFMADNNMSLGDLQSMFYQRILKQIKTEINKIFRQDVFGNRIIMSVDHNIVQVWKNNPEEEMEKLLNAGFQVIYSSPWDLNYEPSERNFDEHYTQDPRSAVKAKVNSGFLQNIVGGEASMWNNDKTKHFDSLLEWIFPQTCAVAEVLWSLTHGRNITKNSLTRMKRQILLMTKRGVLIKSSDKT